MRSDNRAALMRGARICLDERGYSRTRARDVASAAGVSTAAIGYHFGTTESLLLAALVEGLEEWSDALDSRLRTVPNQESLRGRLTSTWGAVLESFQGHRGVLAASFELIARADEDTRLRERLRGTLDETRRSLATQMVGIDATADPERAHRTGAACYAILSGLIVQWLVDPSGLPDPELLTDGLLDALSLSEAQDGR